MNTFTNTPPGPPAQSERARLARLARETALAVPGVVGTDTGPSGLFISVSEGERLEGVICAATQDGGYDVTLRLKCRLVPLPELSENVRVAVATAARVAQLPLDAVHVQVADVAIPGEA